MGVLGEETFPGLPVAPVFEREAVHSIGDIAIYQPDPNVIWVGTGEAWMIEDGKVTSPVRNLRFTQSYLEAMNRVEAIGKRTMLCQAINALAYGGE